MNAEQQAEVLNYCKILSPDNKYLCKSYSEEPDEWDGVFITPADDIEFYKPYYTHIVEYNDEGKLTIELINLK